MSVAIIDFTTHEYTKRDLEQFQLIAQDMRETPQTLLNFIRFTLGTLGGMLIKSTAFGPDDVAGAVLHSLNIVYSEEGIKYSIERHGIRDLTSTWAKEKYPHAKYEVVSTLVSNDKQIVHTLLVFI